MLQQFNFYFVADTDLPLSRNILLHKRLHAMPTAYGPKTFAKSQKILDFSVLVWYDA